MTTQEYMVNACKGGYVNNYLNPKSHGEVIPLMVQEKHLILLDPLAWQAVGKVMGWDMFDTFKSEEWLKMKSKMYMHAMIDALCDEKSIEEFLETL